MRVNIDAQILALWRKAAQHLQSILSAEPYEYVGIAGFSPIVCPMYRPDLSEIAYYEFEVEFSWPSDGFPRTREPSVDHSIVRLPRTDAEVPAFASMRSEWAKVMRDIQFLERPPSLTLPVYSRGFIIVSTDRHDFPIAHWSLDRQPISRQMEEDARAVDRYIAKIYKLDSLSYVAEDADGSLVTQLGQMPIPLDIQPEEQGNLRELVISSTANPTQNTSTASEAPPEYEVIHSAENNLSYEFTPIGGWDELKARYFESFEHHLSVLRDQAAAAWQIDEFVEQFGEGILGEENYQVALLTSVETAEVLGENADIVRLRKVEHIGRMPLLELSIQAETLTQETDVNLRIVYQNGLEENLSFFFVYTDTPSNER